MIYQFANGKEVLVDETTPINVGDLFVNLDDERQDEPFMCRDKRHIEAFKYGGRWAKIVSPVSEHDFAEAYLSHLRTIESRAKTDYIQSQMNMLQFELKMYTGLNIGEHFLFNGKKRVTEFNTQGTKVTIIHRAIVGSTYTDVLRLFKSDYEYCKPLPQPQKPHTEKDGSAQSEL